MITLITNISQLITPEGRGASFGARMGDLRVRDGVEVLISDGRIESIGPAGSHPSVGEVVDAEGCVVLPGLVDPHRHFGAPCVSGIGSGSSVETGTHSAKQGESGADERRLLRGLRRALAEGTSTVEIKCGSDQTVEDEVELLARARRIGRATSLRVSSTLLGTPRGTERWRRDDGISALIGEAIPAARRRRLARFCDVVCGDGGYAPSEADAILRAGRGAGLSPKVHVAGGDFDAAALLAARLDAASIDHLPDCGRRAAGALRKSGVVCVLLPGTAFLYGEPYPNARGMIEAGMAVALGTDYGFEGHGVESVWMSLAMALEKLDMSLEEAITAVTLNAAAALEIADETGSLEPGKAADLAILDVEDHREIAGSVGCDPVRMTIVGGRRVSSP